MTLEEAIKHAEEMARAYKAEYAEYSHTGLGLYANDCRKRGDEYQYISESLKELQKYRELFSSPEEAEEVVNMNMA